MKSVKQIEDVYPAIEELITELKALNESELSAVLDHRMHRVAWTARSELLEELHSVLSKALESEQSHLPEVLGSQIRTLLDVIDDYLDKPNA